MEKKNKKIVGGVLLLLLVVVSCFAITKTYARYATKLSGSDTARVAKWAWNINTVDINSGTTSFDMDLFSNSVLLDSSCNDVDVEGDVKSTDKVIAPGTCGKFDITIKNNSEVNATYAYALSMEMKDGSGAALASLPIKYSTNKDAADADWKTDIADLSVGTTNIAAGATSDTITIYWKWAFGESDAADDATNAADTALGFAGNATLKVKADLTLTQVD